MFSEPATSSVEVSQRLQIHHATPARTVPASRVNATPGCVGRSATGGRRFATGAPATGGVVDPVGSGDAMVLAAAGTVGVETALPPGAALVTSGARLVAVGGRRMAAPGVALDGSVLRVTAAVWVVRCGGVGVRMTGDVLVDVGVGLTRVDTAVGEGVAVGTAGGGYEPSVAEGSG